MKHPALTLMICAAVILNFHAAFAQPLNPASRADFFDDFNDFVADNWQPFNASRWQISMQNGSPANCLSIANPNGDEYTVMNALTWSTFAMEVDAKSLAGTNQNFFIAFGMTTPASLTNYYYLRFAAGSVDLFRVSAPNSGVIIVSVPGDFVSDNQYLRLRIERQSPSIKVFVDGQLLLQVNDATFSAAGYIGFGSFNSTAGFDNVSITSSLSNVGPVVYGGQHATLDDNLPPSRGDNDSRAESCERIELEVSLKNNGTATATNVGVPNLSCADPDITILDPDNGWGDIAGGETKTNEFQFVFKVNPTLTQNKTVTFSMTIYADNGGPWTSMFSVNVYVQDQGQYFCGAFEALEGVSSSAVAWSDVIGNDGRLDFLVIGRDDYLKEITQFYRNDQGGYFTDVSATAALNNVHGGSIAWGNYDNDDNGDLDLLLTGTAGLARVTQIYRYDGGGRFTAIPDNLPDISSGTGIWGDYDNDGDLDILLAGSSSAGNIAEIYKNTKGTFTPANAGLRGVAGGSAAAWGDYDNDGDLDILLGGEENSGIFSTKIYRNDNGSFSDIVAPLPGVAACALAWGDYDGDGNLDILLAGRQSNGSRIAKVYRNNMNGNFFDITAGLIGVEGGSAVWGDYDNDGDLDILLTGDTSNGPIAKVYRNEGAIFSDVNAALTGVKASAAAWGDYDNDGILDILLAGDDGTGFLAVEVYRNILARVNTPPTAPINLTSSPSGSSVTFNWNKSTDSQTRQNGLTYNLRVGTTPNGAQIISPLSNVLIGALNGFRRVPKIGNTNHRNSFAINNLPLGTYYWSVQAIDNAFAGSAFAPQGVFTITPYPPPTLSAINPTSGAVGKTLDVVFTGTNFIDGVTTVNPGAGITANPVKVNAPTSLTATLTISAAAASGPRNFSVTNSGPGGGTSNALTFTVTNLSVTSIAPVSGNRLQRLNVVFTGTGFVAGATVNVGTGITKNSVTVTSATSLTADLTIDATAATGTRKLSVTNPNGETSNDVDFTVNNPLPTLTSIAPSLGNRLQTLDVVFTGANFISGVSAPNLGAGIIINTQTVTSSTSLTANITITANAAAGVRTFSITNSAPGGGASIPQNFTVNNPAPTLSSISPASGVLGQTLDVVFTGTNFLSGTTTPNVGGLTLNTFSVTSATSATANITIPTTAATGAKNFSVTNSSPGGGTSASQIFTVNLPAPILTGISPASGNRLETLEVIFTGTNFISGLTTPNPGAGITVRSVNVTSATSLIASLDITAAAATGPRNFSVSNGSLISNTQTFTVNNPVPTLASLSPAFGIAGQTLDVIFTGMNFINGATVNASSGDITVNPAAVTSPTSLTVNLSISSTAAPGPRSFSVTNPGPGGGTSNSLTFTITRITLTRITPNNGNRLQRLNVVFEGTNFPPTAQVNVGNDITAPILSRSETSITADLIIGANAATGPRDFSVGSTATGGISNTLPFTVTNPSPTLTSLSPANGNRLQTLDVVFTGNNFFSDASEVNAGTGIMVNSTRVTSLTSLTANITIMAAAATGPRSFTVTNRGPGGGVSSPVSFTVNNPAPALISINPTIGVIDQTMDVIFTGMNFIAEVTTPNLGAGITLNSHSVTSSSTLTVNITITPAATAGPKNFSVTNSGPGGGTSGTQIFTVNNPVPILDNIAPATGNRLQTLDVVFTGNNFLNGVTSVNPGSGITVVTMTVNNATSLTARIMITAEAATGPRDFFVSNSMPGGGSSAKKTFTVNNPAPALTSINPTSGGLGQTLTVVFTGTNFINGVSSVQPGNGYFVVSTAVPTSTTLNATISISPTAIPGTRNFAVTNSGPGGGISSAQTFTISNNRAPEISHTPLAPQPEKQDMIIPATITDDGGTPSATLQYRAGGETIFNTVAMTNTGSAYRGTIPGSAVGPRGVEYFISATDGEQSARAPIAGNFLTLILVTNVVRASPQTAGDAATSYRLISVPIQATNASAAAILEDDLGAYDNTKWRLYGLIAGQPLSNKTDAYVEVSQSGVFVPGKSFFLIVRESGKTIDSDGGQSIRTDREYAIPLQTGHNFVATPFNFTIPAGKLRLKSGNVSLSTYQGNWIAASELSPWEGYYLANNSTAAETLFVNPNLSSSAMAKRKDAGTANENAWRVQILASCGQTRDTENFAGVAPISNDQYDFNDLAEPPPIGEYVSVYFPHPEWRKPLERYSDDMRAWSNSNQQWRFVVESNVPNEMVNLRFEGWREIDPALAVVLVDEALNYKQNLRENAVYQYQPRRLDRPQEFTLIVGKEDFVAEQTASVHGAPESFVLEQNFPNPFSSGGNFANPETAIRFGLPQPSAVTIKIFDLAGHEVATLLDRAELPAGRHQRLWNGRDAQGRALTSGIYFCRLTAGSFVKTIKLMLMR